MTFRWDQVQELGGKTLKTVTGRARFKVVEVKDDYVLARCS